MIELSPNTGCMLYLGATLIFLFIVWSYHHYKEKKKKLPMMRQELFVCEYCQFVYLSEQDVKVNKCPQCSSYNKLNFYKRN
jgi:hypothetical protein